MALTNEDRGGLVGGFIVEDGDEVLSITQNGQVVRSPINEDFRPTGRSTMGVKFVTPKAGDAVAVVARSVEAKVVEEATGEPATTRLGGRPDHYRSDGISPDQDPDVTIEESASDSRSRRPRIQATKGTVKADDRALGRHDVAPPSPPPAAGRAAVGAASEDAGGAPARARRASRRWPSASRQS